MVPELLKISQCKWGCTLILHKTRRTYMGKQSVQDCFGCGRQATLALQLITKSLWCLLHWCPCASSGCAFCARSWQQQLSSPSSSCPTLNYKATLLTDSPPTCLLIWVILQLQPYHLSSWSFLSRPLVSFLFPSTPYGRTAGKRMDILMTNEPGTTNACQPFAPSINVPSGALRLICFHSYLIHTNLNISTTYLYR